MILHNDRKLQRLQQAILQVAAYADIFDYPLTLKEIHRYCRIKTTFQDINDEIHRSGLLNQIGDFYPLYGREALIGQRLRREQISARLWPEAIRYGKLIAQLPFIRMVAVTGSLAVNNTEDPADIDYLIVTDPGHLWTGRALILAIGRLAEREGLTLCPNYLITTRGLEFKDRNIYVAHELAQMVPISGMPVYDEIRRRNDWVAGFLPNADGPPPGLGLNGSAAQSSWLKPILETILRRMPPGAWFERWEMERKIRRLSQDQAFSAESRFSADVCKGHDHGHQLRTQKLLEEKASELFRTVMEEQR